MYCLICRKHSGLDLRSCPWCGADIPTQYSDQAAAFASNLFSGPTQIAALTTSGSIFVSIGGEQREVAPATNEVTARAEIEKLLWKHPTLTPMNFTRLDNPMRENIAEARRILTDRVLPVDVSVSSRDKRSVINLMGIALDMQTGKDTLAYDKPSTNRVVPRLSMLKVPQTLRKDYESVHEYYNATKHSNKPAHAAVLSQLGSEEGRAMATRYFEYVRRILQWYYRMQKAPDIPEIEPIDYSAYGITI